jgi:hypothetical protein
MSQDPGKEPDKLTSRTALQDPRAANFPKIGAPALSALLFAGYSRLEELHGVSEREIANLHGVGPHALARLRVALAERGLAFGERAKQ